MFLHTCRPNFGLVTFKLADIGEGIAEVELLRWQVSEGQTIDEVGAKLSSSVDLLKTWVYCVI